ncbi:MAG: ABC transporter substrate-binding protein [Opitutaceae bacterium]
MTTLRHPFLRVLVVAAGLGMALWGWGRFTRPPDFRADVRSSKEIEELATIRASYLDPAKAHHPVVEVDYGEGRHADWYPKAEAPVLAELVSEGALPPVDERTGPEPLVLRGPDGIGRYGGDWADAVTWDSQVWDRMNRYNAGVTLVRWSPNGYPILPHVARSWESSPDLKTWTFHLRRGMRWSDGHPFTGGDFVYWYRWEVLYFQRLGYALNDEGYRLLRSGNEFGRVESVDDLTVQFIFPHPNPFFLEMVAGTSVKELFAPRHYLERFHPELGDRELIAEIMTRRKFSEAPQVYLEVKREDNPEHPRINPWIYRRYSPYPPHRFVRNPYYWAVDPKGNQLPYIDQITEDVMTRELLSLKASSGGFGAIFESDDLDLSNYALYMEARGPHGFDVRHFMSGLSSLWSIGINQDLHHAGDDEAGRQKRELLKNRDFRQALSIAINRNAIIRAEFHGFGEPAQISPGPGSPFHHEGLYRSFTEYDPDRANRLLDGIGLTGRDADGYRTLPDGSPMVWSILHPENVAPGPFQFVIDDWAAVGIRAIERYVNRGLLFTLRMSATFEFLASPSYADFVPVIDPKSYVPVDRFSVFAPVAGTWYEGQLRLGAPYTGVPVERPPVGGLFDRVIQLYDQAMTAPTRSEGMMRFRQIFDLAAENTWTISVASAPPGIAVISDGFRNVPEHGLRGNIFHTPLNLGSEAFFLAEPAMSRSSLAQLKRDLAAPGSFSLLGLSGVDPVSRGAQGLNRLLQWVIGLLGLVGLVMVCVRHPFVGRRLLLFLPMLLVISFMTFTIIQIPPGNIIETRLLSLEQSGTTVSQQEIDRIRAQFHLGDGFLTRYLRWIGIPWFVSFAENDRGLLQGDLGVSLSDPLHPRPVNELVGDRILFTVLLSAGTILFTWTLALPIGILSAVRQYSPLDYALTFVGFVGMSVPGFLLSLLIMYWGGRFLGIDLTGLFSPAYESQAGWTWGKVLDLLKHIWVPLLVLGVEGTAVMIRVMRGNLLDELNKPYVVTARAKGLRPFKLVLKYPVRMAVNPFVSGVGSLLPELISGGAIVSVVLGLPTVGPLMLGAFLNEDIYLAGSMLVVLSLLGIMGTLISDLLLMWLDPRIRMAGVSS